MSKAITVYQLNEYVDKLLKRQPELQNLSVIGELSNIKLHSSGHLYFTLKSAEAAVSCVMFRSSVSRLTFAPREGQEVVADGSVQLYVRDGRYQFYASSMNFSGEGALYKEFSVLKAQLEAAGYFDPAIKKAIPVCRTIGVVTSPTGAVIRDIINVSRRRNPSIRIILCPVAVQGAGASAQIAAGIRAFNRWNNVDAIIIGRGGGSIEDLWAFNELEVAEAIHDSALPVISAVGHQTDFTISDFAADFRAPTPSAAAEVATYDVSERKLRLRDTGKRLDLAVQRKITTCRRELTQIREEYVFENKERFVADRVQDLDYLTTRYLSAAETQMQNRRHEAQTLRIKLETYSPEGTLARGYAMILDENKNVLSGVGEIREKAYISMRDGIKAVSVKE